MNGLNEQELERIAGGEGETPVFNSMAWSKKNCDVCANNSSCRNKNAYMVSARKKVEKGVNNDCPFKS